MSDITLILSQIESGDPSAGEQLLPLVYDELRKLAAARLAQEKPGQTLQATALVHEVYVRLVEDGQKGQRWNGRRHFFAAAAEAMRRILVDNARRKLALKRGGDLDRNDIPENRLIAPEPDDELLAVHEVLDEFATVDPKGAELVKLRYFTGLTMPETAEAMGLPMRTVERLWTYARAWLYHRLRAD